MPTSESREGGTKLTRQQLLAAGAAGGLAFAAWGPSGGIAFAAGTPKRGGTLQVGLVGGSAASEQLDPNTTTVNSLDIARHQNVFSKLADFDSNAHVYPQLAESFTPNKTATSWTVKLKSGVTWHDGSPFTADDVVYSLQRILDPTNKAMSTAAGNLTMVDPSKIVKVDATTVTIGLKQPWSDLPTQLGQRYLAIIKNGTKTFTADTVIGTGPFKLAGWTPGVQTMLSAYSGYFESGKPYLASVVLNGINDPTARLNALQSGQVQAIEHVDPSQIRVLQASSTAVPLISSGGGWTPIVMNTKVKPFTDVRVRQAIKLMANRPQLVKVAEQGFAQVGNDLFAIHDPLYDASMSKRKYDPEKAKSLLKQAGQSDLEAHAGQFGGDARHAFVGPDLRAVREGGGREDHRQEAPRRLVLVGRLRQERLHAQQLGLPALLPAVAAVLPGVQQGRDELDVGQGQQARQPGRGNRRRGQAQRARPRGPGDRVAAGRLRDLGLPAVARRAQQERARHQGEPHHLARVLRLQGRMAFVTPARVGTASRAPRDQSRLLEPRGAQTCCD